MMLCPFCQCPAHTRTSRYLSGTVKQIYYQCTNVLCSATFKTVESVDKVIQPPRPQLMRMTRLSALSPRKPENKTCNAYGNT
ncbi:ogr/Delta-like zinc finger family protein [Hafnia alvei]|uniref:ogr/Delta-like zinc finger family protein n=1 Tax=Hafnia alvei TaxID=569 RepID=UPI0028BEFFA0|nr:ogr/Delta-like zinc finger family protein [Hafnia alvei]WNN52381.1 ogr/Delta-like zinc finger family protein [Hafnia alvei]